MPEEVYGHAPNPVGAGAGNVTGPAGSTDNAIARWNGAGGATLQDSVVLIDDFGVLDLGATGDMLVNRRAAATLNLGGADAAAPVAQRLTAQGARAGTDVDVAGGNLTLQAGLGTGIGATTTLSLAVPITGVTGSAAQVALNKVILTNKIYTMPDTVAVALFSVDLPTANTGATVHTSFTYVVTNGANCGTHAGIIIWAFCNNGGTVTGTGVDSAEATAGTGAGAGIDTESVTVVGTVATAKMAFNTPLNVSGTLTYCILNNSATNLTIL